MDFPSYAKTKRVQEVIQTLPELTGKYDTSTMVMLTYRKPGEPTSQKEALRFAAVVASKLANPFSAAKDEILAIARQVIREGESPESTAARKVIHAKSLEVAANDSGAEDTDVAPKPPVKSVPAVSPEHRAVIPSVVAATGLDVAVVENVVQSFLQQMSGSCLLGLVALTNSLHYLATTHDKLPGSAERIAAAANLNQQYIQAMSLVATR
jgi:hypothetical protein